MKNSSKNYRGKRLFIVDLTCIPRERLLEALSLTFTAAFYLSNSFRVDTCLKTIVSYRDRRYCVEACGARLRGYRPDIGSSTGFLKRVIRNGCYGGACLKDVEACTPPDDCTVSQKALQRIEVKPCILVPCSHGPGDPWWLVAVLNILLDQHGYIELQRFSRPRTKF